MRNQKRAGIAEYFSELSDPRIERQKRHKLIDIVTITICAVISGAESWNEIETYGNAKYEWLKTFLELPNRIPSHDTFNRVFQLISPPAFQECFTNWIQSIQEITKGELVAIDGKTVKQSYDRKSCKCAIHMINAWASKNRLIIGQMKTEEKSNEITAIPELLEVLEISGCIISIDAMGCQKKIAEAIVEKKADYVLAVKGNQEFLHEQLINFFAREAPRFEESSCSYHETMDTRHGRVEVRRYWMCSDIDWLEEREFWRGLRSVGMVESERYTENDVTIERRYYISSLKRGVKKFASAVRHHWGIENSVHWVLDIAFREDESRKRQGYAAENFALVRQIALNLLRQEKSLQIGVKGKRLKAGWDNQYLLKTLNF